MNLAQQIADTVAQAALTDGATTPIGLRTGAQGALMDQANAPVPLPPANGALTEASDDEMSEVTAAETAARQLLLDTQSNEFLLAQDAGILNPEGEALFTDGTWRPRGYDSSVAPSVLLPPVATEHFRLDTPPREEV